MSEEKITEFLKENLSVSVSLSRDYDNEKRIHVRLLFNGEVFSEEECGIGYDPE